jgi:anaerobic sulfite reductase subunit B
MIYEPEEFKITSVRKITKDIKIFRVKTSINPNPGQFFQVSVLGVGECPLASCSHNSSYVDMLVRNAGSVTSALFNLKKDNKILIRGPYGKGFPTKNLEKKHLFLFAGGTGIAPVTSFIEYIEKKVKYCNASIYFGFRNKEYILLKDRIKKWKKKFNVTVSLDKKHESWKGETGFLSDIIKIKKPGCDNSMAFLCGPEIMMKSVTEQLNSLGLENKNIYWSLERRMECGIGSCGRCLLQDVYVCRDGPVFRYDKIKPKLENEKSKY